MRAAAHYTLHLREAQQRHNKPPPRSILRGRPWRKKIKGWEMMWRTLCSRLRLSFFYLLNRTLSGPLSGTIPREPTGAQKTLFIHKRNRKRQLCILYILTHTHLPYSAVCVYSLREFNQFYSKCNCPSNSFQDADRTFCRAQCS